MRRRQRRGQKIRLQIRSRLLLMQRQYLYLCTSKASKLSTPIRSRLDADAGALDVLQIRYQSIGPSKEWLPVRRYEVDKHAKTSIFANGVAVNVYEGIVPGRTIRITFTKEPTELVNDADVFTTVTGLPSSCEDLIRFGAAYRLVPFFESARLSGQSAESDFGGANRQPGGASQLSKFLLQMYQIRLAEETKGLQSVFPIRSHYTR